MDKDVYVPLVKNGYMPNGSGAVPFVRGNGLTTSGGDDAPAPDNAPTHDPNYEKRHKTTMGIFKGFTEAVEQSNPPYVWEWKDQTLVGRVVGAVLGEREYRKQNGEIGTAWDVRFKTAAAIRESQKQPVFGSTII